jgi:histone deacetylase 11
VTAKKDNIKLIFTLILFFSCSCAKDSEQVEGETSGMNIAQLPIIFSADYDISLYGLEKLHAFDTGKYGKVFHYLTTRLGISEKRFWKARPVTDEELLTVHSRQYLDSLSNPEVIAGIAELEILTMIPQSILAEKILKPMKFAVGGTILGLELALKHGWAINLSGGFHHAKADRGGGFCFFADIPIAVFKLLKGKPDLKVLIIDLDAHQGNGYAEIFKDKPGIFIFDVYNEDIFPGDQAAKKYIDFNFPVHSGIDDEVYLALLARELPAALDVAKPNVIIYNAGTDIYKEDSLGRMNISKEGIIKRDELVFTYARKQGIPVLMLLSGGYSEQSADIISHSIENLLAKVLEVEL